MAWRIGIDEAGLGPNLGPFIVSAVVWEVPDNAGDVQLWNVFPDVLTDDPRDPRQRLAVADSKALFQPHSGLKTLERSVLALLGQSGTVPAQLSELHACLGAADTSRSIEPWITGEQHPLPCEGDLHEIAARAQAWSDDAQRVGWRFHAAVSAVIAPREFNQRLDQTGNKATVTSGVHAEVLRRACDLTDNGPVAVYSDKHGGRNRYAGLLTEIFPDDWIEIVTESADSSRYRAGQTHLRFEPRAERYAEVALASMISKYLRELHMHAFNAFWRREQPDLKPTQGYPVDAKRFFAAIESSLPHHGLLMSDVWRNK